jgi:MYXO-CTERM domain-containing protein
VDSEAEASDADKGCGGCSQGASGGAAAGWAAAVALGLGLRRRRA